MSEEKNLEQEIFIADTDIQHIEKFFDHFKVTMPEELIKAIAEFRTNQTSETQRDLRFKLAKAMIVVKGKNELLDEVFEKVFDCTTEISYNLQFEKDLEEIIGSTDQKNQGSES